MITEIYYHADEFCKRFEKENTKRLLSSGEEKRKKDTTLSLSEVIAIMVYFHFSDYKDFKSYYKKCVQGPLRTCFNELVSYSRFIELKQMATPALLLFAQMMNQSCCTGVSYIDSFSLPVCHVKRSYSHKVFKTKAKKGKTSVGWFFGFKLHVVTNHRGGIINFTITSGNVHDSSPNVINHLTKRLQGLLFGDKGYIGDSLFKMLWSRGIKLVTKVRKNMKNKLMDMTEKLLLKKRGLIESVGNILKNVLQIQHTRHRSQLGLISTVCSGLVAYAIRDKKPSIEHLFLQSIAQNP